MEKSSTKHKQDKFTRESIIGLGSGSFRKSYFPLLQKRIVELEELNSRNEALINTIPDLLLIYTKEGTLLSLNEFNINASPNYHLILDNPETLNQLKDHARNVISTQTSITWDITLVSEKQSYHFESRLHSTSNQEVLIMIRDMTQEFLLLDQLKNLVEKDSLTQLYNRHSFEDHMSLINNKDLKNLAVLSIDVNGLKFINDTLGHLHGDQIIIAAANCVSKVFSPYGIVARIGGDEFGAILKEITLESLAELFDLLEKEIDTYNTTESQVGGLSLAYGYSYHEFGIVNSESMYLDADNNMYQHKLANKEIIRNRFIHTFLHVLQEKDISSAQHIERVENLTVLMANHLHFPAEDTRRLRLLASFHDIGKIAISDDILTKVGHLDKSDWNIIKTHPSIGERIAQQSLELQEISQLILKHHEHWDGRGYPLGLKGFSIPIECRIFSIVDAYDVMTHDQPYKSAISHAKAIQEIKNCSGTQFDPNLVQIFLHLPEILQKTQEE